MKAEQKIVEKLVAERDALTSKATQQRAEAAKMQSEIDAALAAETFNDAAAAVVTTKRARVEYLTNNAKRLDDAAGAFAPQINDAVEKWRIATLEAVRDEQQRIADEVAKFFRKWMPKDEAESAAVFAGPAQTLESIASNLIYGIGNNPLEMWFKRLVEMWERQHKTGSFLPPPNATTGSTT